MRRNSVFAPCLVTTVPSFAMAKNDEKAAACWTSSATGLEDAVMQHVVGRIGEQGAGLSVDPRKVELASASERALAVSDAILVGPVDIFDLSGNENFDADALSISVATSQVACEDGPTLTNDTLDYRAASVAPTNRFADNVVSRLE
jgi:hypothetical protein